MDKITQINAGMIVAFQEGEHRILPRGVLVMQGEDIIHIGESWTGTADIVIDAQNEAITPGFITTHLHAAESPLDKSWIEDVGSRLFSYSGLSEMLPARAGGISPAAADICAEFSMVELIKTGTTTIMEQGESADSVLNAAEKTGIRAYIASAFRSGRWLTRNGRKMEYEWFPDEGAALFDRAMSFFETIKSRQDSRLRGFVAPSQIDTITPSLLRRAKDFSDSHDLPITLHASQSVFEFDEMIQRHGMTPIEWLYDQEFLGKNTLLGHAIYISGNSWVQLKGNDLQLLKGSYTSVAHSPWVFARRGIAMESYAAYQEAGINMTLGTDTAPQSMIEAMRLGAVLGKVTARDTNVATARDLFNAATVNAADYLNRQDLGRLCVGAKADLVFWSLESLTMSPVRDLIKNIVYSATPSDISKVIINGSLVLEDNVVKGVDEHSIIKGLQHHAGLMWDAVSAHDWAGRTADEMSPPSFSMFVA